MPVVIIGLNTALQHNTSDIEDQIAKQTPRCMLSWSGVQVDKNALTATQTKTNFETFNENGLLDNLVLEYRRLPLDFSFGCTFVFDSISDAMLMAEYVAMLSIEIPVIDGDLHTRSTLIFSETSNVVNDVEKNDVAISNSLRVNMQIVEPTVIATEDLSKYLLNNVGKPNDDGTFDETKLADNAELDADGRPIDKTGFTENANSRLNIRTKVTTPDHETIVTRHDNLPEGTPPPPENFIRILKQNTIS
jgi:hypothetical protein